VDLLKREGIQPDDLPKGERDQYSLDEGEILDVDTSPFQKRVSVSFPFDPKATPPLGFTYSTDKRFRRAFASEFTHPDDQKRYLNAFILKIGDTDVYSVEDVDAVIDTLCKLKDPPPEIEVLLATDWLQHLSDSRHPPLHLRACDIRRIAALQSVAGEGLSSTAHRQRIRDLANSPSRGHTLPDPDDLKEYSADELLEIRRLQNEHMTDKEKKLSSFTRKNVMRLANWKDWRDADDKQLDAHFDAGAIGKAVPRPQRDPNRPNQVFRAVWAGGRSVFVKHGFLSYFCVPGRFL